MQHRAIFTNGGHKRGKPGVGSRGVDDRTNRACLLPAHNEFRCAPLKGSTLNTRARARAHARTHARRIQSARFGRLCERSLCVCVCVCVCVCRRRRSHECVPLAASARVRPCSSVLVCAKTNWVSGPGEPHANPALAGRSSLRNPQADERARSRGGCTGSEGSGGRMSPRLRISPTRRFRDHGSEATEADARLSVDRRTLAYFCTPCTT